MVLFSVALKSVCSRCSCRIGCLAGPTNDSLSLKNRSPVRLCTLIFEARQKLQHFGLESSLLCGLAVPWLGVLQSFGLRLSLSLQAEIPGCGVFSRGAQLLKLHWVRFDVDA